MSRRPGANRQARTACLGARRAPIRRALSHCRHPGGVSHLSSGREPRENCCVAASLTPATADSISLSTEHRSIAMRLGGWG